jgi:exodeoxyribonuclease III
VAFAMLLASWNINSIRARHERFLAWLAARQPDVLCLQELKATEAQFPFEAVKAAGYHAAVHGQKTYNGVAILAKTEPEDVRLGLDDGGDEMGARVISAVVGGLRIVNVYVVNGQVVGSEKYAAKLEWMRRLRASLDARHRAAEPLVLCGDFNVAPEDRDVDRPEKWASSVLFHADARDALRHILAFGFADTLRLHTQDAGLYSWWDYRKLSFPKNDGLRLDLILATPSAARACTAASIDRNERKGKLASDHAPVLAAFDI